MLTVVSGIKLEAEDEIINRECLLEEPYITKLLDSDLVPLLWRTSEIREGMPSSGM